MAKSGREVKAYIGVRTTSGNPAVTTTTYTWLAGEQSNNFNKTQAQLEITDKSSAWQKFLGGVKGATAEVTVFANNADTQQAAAIKSLHDGATIPVFIGTLDTSSPAAPADGEVFDALVTSISDTAEVGGVATRTLSLVASGEVSHYPAFT